MELSINRNILECKVRQERKTFPARDRINRNILECKERTDSYFAVEGTVLIETYWNVKSKKQGENYDDP